MKKVILLAACLFTISTATKAQEAPKAHSTEKVQHEKLTPDQRAQKNVDGINNITPLTEDQKTKIKNLALTRITKADAIRAKYKGQEENKATSKSEIDVVRKEYSQSVKALLTPEQLEKLKAKHKEMKDAKTQDKNADAPENIIDTKD